MKWTLQRKAAVALLALAGAAFCVDRFVLGYSPSAASAVGAVIGLALPAPAKDAPAPAIRTVSLADRVAGIPLSDTSPDSASDAFAIPARWKPLVLPDAPASPRASEAAPEPAQFTMTAVITGVGRHPAAARINGRIVQVGGTIAGRTLLRIECGRAFTAILSGTGPQIPEIRVPLTIGDDTLSQDDPAPSPKS